MNIFSKTYSYRNEFVGNCRRGKRYGNVQISYGASGERGGGLLTPLRVPSYGGRG